MITTMKIVGAISRHLLYITHLTRLSFNLYSSPMKHVLPLSSFYRETTESQKGALAKVTQQGRGRVRT